MIDVKNPKNPNIFSCNYCDYHTSNKKDYTKHTLTQKHKILTNTYVKIPKISNNYNCECGKSYKYRQSLYSHKKKCSFEETITEIVEEKEENVDYKDMFLTMMKENRELQNTIINQQQVAQNQQQVAQNNNKNTKIQ